MKQLIQLKQLLITGLLLFSASGIAQVKIGDNVTNVDPNAVLEMESSSKGLLLPRMTGVERDAIVNPTNSMLIFNTSENCINIYNSVESKWKSICGESGSGSSVYSVNCSSLVVSGVYQTGVALDPDTNYITVTVDVLELGSYELVSHAAGIYFSKAGTFTTLGQQDIILTGQGYPLVAGLNFLAIEINDSLCTTVLNVTTGLANVTGCGTLGALTGNIYANQTIQDNAVYQSYTAGPSYTGGGVFGITSASSNGIRISSPVNGTFMASGIPVDYFISGTPIQPGSTTLNYSINGFACSFTVPIQSGTGRASAVSCGGALSGVYNVGTSLSTSNTKIVTLTVSTPGTFYLRTNTANGIYFSGSATATTTGSLNVTLTGFGTPASNTTDTFTVTVSSSATAFVNCTFNVATVLPPVVPTFNTLSCSSFSASVSYIKSNNSGTYDYFGGYTADANYSFGKGTKISSDGLTLAVAAVGEDGDLAGGAINSVNNNNWSSSGAVYIYTRSNISSNWTFQAKLKPTQLESSDHFGISLDISNDGNTLVVGSSYEDGSGTGVNPAHNNNALEAGAAYVFVRTGSTWVQQAYLKSNESTSRDFFGVNVAISGDGNTVAVGAIGEDSDAGGINPTINNGTKISSGAVYVYNRIGSTWSFKAFIKSANPDKDDWFGTDVSLNNDGTTLAVGAQLEDGGNMGVNPIVNNSLTDSGAVYVFRMQSGIWSQEAYIKAGQVSAGDLFGRSVDLDSSGNTLVVGVINEDGNGIGVNPAINESSSNSGAVYVYNRSGSVWSQSAYLKASNTGADDNFGRSVTISNDGGFILVGSMFEDGTNSCVSTSQNNSGTNRGALYLYSLIAGNWISSFQFKHPQSAGSSNSDLFGACVSISGNGRTVVGSSPGEDGNASGINPLPNDLAEGAGAVLVFTRP